MTKKQETKIMGDFGPELNISAVYTEETNKQVESLVKSLQEVSKGKVVPNFKHGDTLTYQGKIHKVVEVLDTNRWHLKNTEAPFNSFVITADDLKVDAEKEGE